MANTKISALTDGTTAAGTDEFPVARAGANRKLTIAQLFASPTFTGTANFPDGSVTVPSIAWTSDADGSGTGFYRRAANVITVTTDGTASTEFAGTRLNVNSGVTIGWSAASTTVNSMDTSIARAGANSIIFGGSSTGSTATSRTSLNKVATAIADNSATAVLTVTIPNAAHSASLRVKLKGSIGAGGAIGANEATESIWYDIDIARTAGVNAVATLGTGYGGTGGASVSGAATIAVTGTISAISGAVGATNTFTVNVTIAKGSGSSANHTCFVYAELINDNASGVTIA